MKTSPSSHVRRLATAGALAASMALASCERVSDTVSDIMRKDPKAALRNDFREEFDGNGDKSESEGQIAQEQTEATDKLLDNLLEASKSARAGEKVTLEQGAFRQVRDFLEENTTSDRAYRVTLDFANGTYVNYTFLVKGDVVTITWGGTAKLRGVPVRGTRSYKESRKGGILKSEDNSKTWLPTTVDQFQADIKSLKV